MQSFYINKKGKIRVFSKLTRNPEQKMYLPYKYFYLILLIIKKTGAYLRLPGASYLAGKESINGSGNARFLARPAWRFQKSAPAAAASKCQKTTSLTVHPETYINWKIDKKLKYFFFIILIPKIQNSNSGAFEKAA